MYNIIAIIGLFIGIMFTYVNISRALVKKSVPTANMVALALGWTMFISAMWILP